ncbi:MAG: hypothetical protein ACR2O1_07555 [Boseongicola sp.]
MSIVLRAAVIGAVPFLGACAGLIPTEYVQVVGSNDSMEPSQFFAAAYTDDGETDLIEHLLGNGLTGFVGNSDGTVSEVRVRFDNEDEVVYVSIGGGAEIVYDDFGKGDFEDDEGWIEIANAAAQYAYFEFNGYEPSQIELDDEGTGAESDGYFGAETAHIALPTETATYHGYWDAEGHTGTSGIEAGGHMGLAVGFGSGNITGYAEGGFNAWNDDTETEDGGSFVGGITGSVVGSRIAGTMSVDGDASGDIDLMGAIYGEEGEFAAGGIGGSLTSEAGELNLGGDFFLYNEGGEGPCCFD